MDSASAYADPVATRMWALYRSASASNPAQPWRATAEKVAFAASERGPSRYQALATIVEKDLEANTSCHSEQQFIGLVLFELYRRLTERTMQPPWQLPNGVRTRLVHEANRILLQADERAYHASDLNHDYFRKDLAILAGRLLPVGAELIQPYAGIPRSLLVRGGARQAFRAAGYFLLRRKGFAAYCALHLDGRQLRDFNPRGWRQTYCRIGEFLKLNPDIRGVFGSAWFYDPVVSEISPHLAYIREIREAGGARNFFYTSSKDVAANALAKSKRRQTLYRNGQYIPRAYYLVWHRKELITWAGKQQPDTERSCLE